MKIRFKDPNSRVESFKPSAKQKYYFVAPDGTHQYVDCYLGDSTAYILTGNESEATKIARNDFHKLFRKVKNGQLDIDLI